MDVRSDLFVRGSDGFLKGGEFVKLPGYVKEIIGALESAGFEAYAVGGCVRDSLLGITPSDFDVCTSAKPDQIKQCFSHCRVIPTGEKHGTVTVITEAPVEITTFRTEGQYSDNRHPDKVTFVSSVKEDLSRRDFTVNAMAFSPEKGIVDPFCGMEDLKRRLIRCVGDPDTRFCEDGLRIMRALRFASTYGFEIEERTCVAIHKNRELLKGISVERLFAEMTKLLLGKGASPILREYSDVIGVFIPEILPMIGFDQRNPHHHLDVWEHTLAVLKSTPGDRIMSWAALLHDIGKPSCYTFGADKKGHFKGHQQAGAEIADALLGRLRCDNATRQAIVALIANHDLYFKGEAADMQLVINRLGKDCAGRVMRFRIYDSMAQSPSMLKEKLEQSCRALAVYEKVIGEGLCCFVSDLAIGGSEIKQLGVPAGARIGKMLDRLLLAVIGNECANERDALISYVKNNLMKVQ